MSFPGLAIIGCENLAGIYGVNEGIIDAKGTGVQHLFHGGFEKDLIHSATTLIKDGNTIYYGNRRETAGQHPIHLKPTATRAEGGYVFADQFDCGGFERNDRAFAWGAANLGFETEIHDRAGVEREIEVYAYVIAQPQAHRRLARQNDRVIASGENCHIGVHFAGAYLCTLLEEGPTGFIYRLTSALLHGQSYSEPVEAHDDMLCGILLGRRFTLPAGGKVSVSWSMGFSDRPADLEEQLDELAATDGRTEAMRYWETYLGSGETLSERHSAFDRANQVAIKSAMIAGFVPADLTGHYYSHGLPCYYARDALMAARAFLLSGHLDEARQVIAYLLERERKPSGEFFQRYNGLGLHAEGANNNVFHQLDSIGYLLKLLHDYEQMSGELLLPRAEIASLARVIINAEKKNGLAGPEGGVNEGVFGPAFIVSSNMFIYGGLKAAAALLGDHPMLPDILATNAGILAGIEGTFVPGEGYRYGYVTYHDELIMKYDTPQYFGLLYGFEDTANMRETHALLLKLANFDGHGMGYSEQEYHHGPWTFNTAACAQYAYLIGDHETYADKLDWLETHANTYGLMPEAFSADNPEQCYINPLVWACAEVVSALHIHGALQ